MNQDIILQAAYAEQHVRQLEENLQLVDTQIAELTAFTKTLETLKNTQEKEMLASLGRRVYLKVKREEEMKLWVEVGAGVVVKKTPQETLEVVNQQKARLEEARREIAQQFTFYQRQLEDFLQQVQDQQ